MDAFEQIRGWSAHLHDELANEGVDPLQPGAMIAGAARRLDVELVELASGDPALKGARALFDEQSRTICYERTPDIGERAQLVAHELGHARLHATSTSCTAHDIDPSQSTEPAPVGLQRVEDYGARERRELQANVFAREFLLPRRHARRLHIDLSMGARAIEERTGLPVNLVRQQLFDALLLPPLTEEGGPSPEEERRSPDPSQDNAVEHLSSPFQLQAGPGTGKTQTLVKRVLWLLEKGVDPAGILILTFSNRAAGEVAERVVAAAPDAGPRVWIGTFHAFGLDLVRRYHDRLDLPSNPALFDRSDAIEVLEEILPTLPLQHYRNLWDPAMELREIVGAISRAKDEMTDPSRYRALSQAMLDTAVGDEAREAAEKCLEVAHVYELYEQEKRAQRGVDFGDLIMRPALLLEADPELRVAVQFRHRHILVDEYQDVNRASTRLLKAAAGDGKRLWVVGDSRQSIYRFRGASSANMATFSADYDGAAVAPLSVNYRSSQQIVDVFVAAASRMGASDGMLPLALRAARGPCPSSLQVRRHDVPDEEAAGIASAIRELEADGVELRDQAVLCRTNARLNDIAAALEIRGIPVLHLGSLFEREEVRDVLALLSLAVDRFGHGLVRVGAMPRYGLSLQDVHAATRQLREGERPALQCLREIAAADGVSKEAGVALARLADDLDGLTSSVSAWEFLATYLLDRTDTVREFAQRESVQDRMRAIALWQFLNFVREQGPIRSGPPIRRTLDRVRQLVLLAEERDLRQVPSAGLHMNAVRLMTVHGSKGLEFHAVHVPGLTKQSFPQSNRGQRCPPPIGMVAGAQGLSTSEHAKQAQEHEEECLFFVALSRARTHLRLYLARKHASGRSRTPSPFLDWLPTPPVVEVPRAATMPLPEGAPTATRITVSHSPDWQITDARLREYDRCPRRFFYTQVLGLGGARKPTAFTRTHDCLYELIRWMADSRRDHEVTVEEAEAAFEKVWLDRGPTGHGYAAAYRQLASRLVGSLVASGAGRRFREAQPLALDLPNGRVIVEPDEIAERQNGLVVLRRVRTGHKRTKEYDRLDYTLYQLAGQANFGQNFVVEAAHLTDGVVEDVTVVDLTAQKIATRRDNSNEMLAGIAAGHFPPEVDAVTCPRCPHFFICAATPRGPLTVT